jgi:hypothetical protein
MSQLRVPVKESDTQVLLQFEIHRVLIPSRYGMMVS